MREFLQNLFPKYYYEAGDVIYIKSSLIMDPEVTKLATPALLKVEVIERKLTGYIVADANGVPYFIKNAYVVSKVVDTDDRA